MNLIDSYNLLVERLSVIVEKIVEYHLEVSTGIAIHEIIDYVDLSLKEQVLAQSEKVVQLYQMYNMPHTSPMIPMRASVK